MLRSKKQHLRSSGSARQRSLSLLTHTGTNQPTNQTAATNETHAPPPKHSLFCTRVFEDSLLRICGYLQREDFAGLLNNLLYSDVTLKVENRSIPAHRFILKVRCEHFRAMFDKYVSINIKFMENFKEGFTDFFVFYKKQKLFTVASGNRDQTRLFSTTQSISLSWAVCSTSIPETCLYLTRTRPSNW